MSCGCPQTEAVMKHNYWKQIYGHSCVLFFFFHWNSQKGSLINNIQDQDLYLPDPYLTRFFSSFLEEIKEESKKLR